MTRPRIFLGLVGLHPMKRLLRVALLVGAACFCLPSTSKAQVTSVFSAVSTNADSTTMAVKPANMPNGIIACGTRCDFRVWSDAGSGAIVTAYCRISSSDSETWYACSTVTNPTNGGNYISLATSREYKFAIESWSSGAIHVKFFTSSQ